MSAARTVERTGGLNRARRRVKDFRGIEIRQTVCAAHDQNVAVPQRRGRMSSAAR